MPSQHSQLPARKENIKKVSVPSTVHTQVRIGINTSNFKLFLFSEKKQQQKNPKPTEMVSYLK